MGMFDDVDFELACPNCDEIVKGWQSKDGECTMAMVKPETVRRFYSLCGHCGTWIEMKVIPEKVTIVVDSLKLLDHGGPYPGRDAAEARAKDRGDAPPQASIAPSDDGLAKAPGASTTPDPGDNSGTVSKEK